MTPEFIAFCVLILLHIRWAIRESEAEKQRDGIRKDLINTMHQIVEAQDEFRPLVHRIVTCLNKIEGR